MEISLTVIISVVLAICTVVSPIITTILNNRHQLKLRKLDMKLEQEKSFLFYKREIYENYSKFTSAYLQNRNAEDAHNYGEYYALALLYFPKEMIPQLTSINKQIESRNYNVALEQLETLSVHIRTTLKTL